MIRLPKAIRIFLYGLFGAALTVAAAAFNGALRVADLPCFAPWALGAGVLFGLLADEMLGRDA